MEISQKNLFTKRDNNKNRRWVAFSLAGLLASGAAVATSAVIASESHSNNANTNIGNSTNHERYQLSQAGGGVLAAPPLTEDERNNFQQAIEAIQSDINDKLAQASLELTVNDFKLDPITEEKETSYADARADFANDLGIKGEVANELFTAIDAFLDSDLFSSTTHSLRDGLSFLYTRSGLRRDGTAVGRLRAIYRTNGERPITPLTEHAFALSITVTGINVNVQTKNTVDVELRRLADLNLTGTVHAAMQNATNDTVTDFTPFGIANTNFDFNKFNYLVSHSPIPSSGSYEMVLKVTTKSNAIIVSSALNISINADIPGIQVPLIPPTTTDDNGDASKVGYIAGGVVGSLGLISITGGVVYGARKLLKRFGAGGTTWNVGRGVTTELTEQRPRFSRCLSLRTGSGWLAGSHDASSFVEGLHSETPPSEVWSNFTQKSGGFTDVQGRSASAITAASDDHSLFGNSQRIENLYFEAHEPAIETIVNQDAPLDLSFGSHSEVGAVGREIGAELGHKLSGEIGGGLGSELIEHELEESIVAEVQTFYLRLAERMPQFMPGLAPEDLLFLVEDLATFSTAVEETGGIQALSGFSALPDFFQAQLESIIERLPAGVSEATIEDAAILRELTGDVSDASRYLFALKQSGAIAAEDSVPLLRTLFGRYIGFTQAIQLTTTEALSLMDASISFAEDTFTENGLLEILAHIILPT